jgi:hypothetical protein
VSDKGAYRTPVASSIGFRAAGDLQRRELAGVRDGLQLGYEDHSDREPGEHRKSRLSPTFERAPFVPVTSAGRCAPRSCAALGGLAPLEVQIHCALRPVSCSQGAIESAGSSVEPRARAGEQPMKPAVRIASESLGKSLRDSRAFLVGAAGFEPTTCSTQNCRATRLRYTPILPRNDAIHGRRDASKAAGARIYRQINQGAPVSRRALVLSFVRIARCDQ